MVDHIKIQDKWQKKWAKIGYVEPEKRKKFFMIFAYPGISGYMHLGHMRGFSYTDAICRYKRMNGYNVLFPVGTHASGNIAYAFLRKVNEQNKDWMEYLRYNGCTEKDIKGFKTAEKIIDYFNESYVEDFWKKFGFISDWRRFTSTVYPDYQQFIRWQFLKLQEKELLVQKPYFATACAECGPVAVDPSETDIAKGGKAEKKEFVLMKYKYGDAYLIAATLRPETMFGQTNLWANPLTEYLKVEVDVLCNDPGVKCKKEIWIVSGPCAEKLGWQKENVKIISKVFGKELIGKFAHATNIGRDLMILPAEFCDPDIGTGIVTSVPSDAPYDWIALHDIQNDADLMKNYGIDAENVRLIKPIPIIVTKGWGPMPGVEICEKMGIKNQKDSKKLEEATAEIYKAGYHTGVMADTCGKYHGWPVEKAKDTIKEEFIASGKADVFHDLSEEVVCRCGKRVFIKKIDDQWFIKYSDEKLTLDAKECASAMEIYPEEFKRNLPSVLDWFSDRACARLGKWIGTPMPQDKKWIVEPISDSTLYPIYYLVSKYVNSKEIKAEQMKPEFFDYVFLGKGDMSTVEKSTGIGKGLLKQIREDVEYWYPLDINQGGKEHQTVHFPVFIMNHAGILPSNMWPKGIFVNWWLTGKGGKISKSKGGAQNLPDAVSKFSVDGLRLYYAHIGSPYSDIEWDEDIALTYKGTVDRVYSMVDEILKLKRKSNGHLENWLMSRANEHIQKIEEGMKGYDLRVMSTIVYYNMYEDMKWYFRRGGESSKVVKAYLEIWAKLMCPVTPHLAEEVWASIKQKGLVSVALWPKADETKIDHVLDHLEEQLSRVLVDVVEIKKLAKIEKPSEIMMLVADSWKYRLVEELRKQLAVTRNVGEVLKGIMRDENLRQYGGEVQKIVLACLKDPSKVPAFVGTMEEEKKFLEETRGFLEKEIGCAVKVMLAAGSTEPKAKNAMPGKTAIVVR